MSLIFFMPLVFVSTIVLFSSLPHNVPWMIFIETVLQVVGNLSINFTFGLVMHLCVIIITWTNAYLLSIRPSETNIIEIWIKTLQFDYVGCYFVSKMLVAILSDL